MENWLGQIQIKVDDKGRFLIPSQALGSFPDRELVLSLGVYDKKPFLEILTQQLWDQKVLELEKLPARNPKVKAYKRFLLSGSAKVGLDKQNRVTLPPFQRERIQVSKNAVLVQTGDKIELWSEEIWTQVTDTFIESMEDIEQWNSEILDENTLQEKEHDLKSVA